jgi:hypothetical protein
MRAAPSALVTLTATLMCVALTGASEAIVHGDPGLRPRPGPAAAAPVPVARVLPVPSAPPGVSQAALDGLGARASQAIADAAADGADVDVVVHDRVTGQTVSAGDAGAIETASVAKLFMADDLFYQVSTGQTQLSADDRQALDAMLRSSDDNAGEQFWQRGGGDAITTRVAARYGLGATGPGSDGRWWNTVTTAADLVRYYDMLLAGKGGLPPEQAGIIIDDLARSTAQGVDGYPQRFGIPDGLYAEPVAVKQGWMCCIGPNWMHLSTGVIGPGHRYIMVIESQQASDDATARNTITRAVKTMFPTGRIE